MVNTGRKEYSTLVQVYEHTGLPTGTTKANSPADADYIPPSSALIDCPPPLPNSVINGITIEFKNLSSQSIWLSNINAVPSHLTLLDTYYNNLIGFGLLPTINYSTNKKFQLSNWTNLQFTLQAASLGIRVKVTMSYKKHTALSYSVVRELNANVGSVVNELLLDTPRELTGALNVNYLKIEFTDNP